MNKTIILFGGIVVLVIVGFVGWQTLGQKSSPKTQDPSQTSESTNQSSTSDNSNNQFQTPEKSAHYESNTPAHGTVLAAPPVNIVIDFNFDLAKPSSISITKGGKEEGLGDTTIDTNKLALRRNFNPTAPDGTYTVNYKACWPDGSCHDGSFQFAINRTEAEKAVDMRNKDIVNIDLASIAFNPKDIRISKGTKVVWTNSDNTIHYINTDSHPSHTYFPSQNSKALNKTDTYSLTFNTPGAYPYHCSAHADSMTGTIIVE